MQVVGVGACNRSQSCWVTANQDGFLLPRAGPSWKVLWTQCRLDHFSVLACCQDVQRAFGWSRWDEVTSSVPCQNGSDEHVPSQCVRSQLPERFGGIGSSWCVVILWGASSLCSDVFLTPNTDQSYMLVYTSSKFVPGVFILQLFKPYSYEWLMWSGLWRRKFSLSSMLGILYTLNQLYIKWSSSFSSHGRILVSPWLDMVSGLMCAEAGWVDLVIVFICAVIEIDIHWNPSKSWIKFNSIAVKGAALYGAQHSGPLLRLLSALVIKIISNKATVDNSLVKVCCLNWNLQEQILTTFLAYLFKEILKTFFFFALKSMFFLYLRFCVHCVLWTSSMHLFPSCKLLLWIKYQ